MIDHYARTGNRKAFPSLVAAVGTTVAALMLVLLLPEKERANLTDVLYAFNLFIRVSTIMWCQTVVPTGLPSGVIIIGIFTLMPNILQNIFRATSVSQERRYGVQAGGDVPRRNSIWPMISKEWRQSG